MKRSSTAIVVQREPSVSSSGSRSSRYSSNGSYVSYSGTDSTCLTTLSGESHEPRTGRPGRPGSSSIHRAPHAANHRGGVVIHQPRVVVWNNEPVEYYDTDEREPRVSSAANSNYYRNSHRSS